MKQSDFDDIEGFRLIRELNTVLNSINPIPAKEYVEIATGTCYQVVPSLVKYRVSYEGDYYGELIAFDAN